MRRQLYRGGGITRQRYGLGDLVRKLIPNEIADVAVKAAPFVAPFNPGVAGLMRGIGRYDQRGSLSDALKQGLATTAFGAGTRYLGGATEGVMGGGLTGGFTNPIGPGGPISRMWGAIKPASKTTAETAIGSIDSGRAGTSASAMARKAANAPNQNWAQRILYGDAATGGKGAIGAGGEFAMGKAFGSGIPAVFAGGTLAAMATQAAMGDVGEREAGESLEAFNKRRKGTVSKYLDMYFRRANKFRIAPENMDAAAAKFVADNTREYVASGQFSQGGRVGLYGGGEAGIKSLDTGAPDITYEGNEGPQAPMKMAFDDTPGFELKDLDLLIEEYKQDNNGRGPVSIDDLRRFFYNKYGPDGISKVDQATKDKQMASAVTGGEERDIAGEMWMKLDKQTQSDYGSFENYFKSGDWIEGVKQIDPGWSRGPVIPSPEDPINPFTPKPTGPVLPDKMMAAKGGRIGYNLGTDPRALMGAPGLAGMQSAPRPAMDPRGLRGLPGIPRMAPDGMEFDMRENGGFQGLGAKEGKDDVPAMLAKNEFVFTADAVRGAGGGDIELGAQRMYDTMKNLEKRVV